MLLSESKNYSLGNNSFVHLDFVAVFVILTKMPEVHFFQVGDEWQSLINVSCQDRINMLKRKFYSGCPSENKENYFEQTANSL